MAQESAVREDFDRLIAGMVYGEAPSFEEAMSVVEKLASQLK